MSNASFSYTIRYVVVLWIGLLPIMPLLAQETTRLVYIERADSLAQDEIDGEQVRKLIGLRQRVRLRQDQAVLEAWNATQFQERDEILFTGQVRIIDETDTLTADQVLYNSRTRIGQADGRVRLSDDGVLLLAPTGIYYRGEKRARFEEGVTLVDSVSTLSSRLGEYRIEDKIATFSDSVRLYQADLYLEADSVIHHRETDVTDAFGRVFIERWETTERSATINTAVTDSTETKPETSETQRRTFLTGEVAHYEKARGLSRITGRPLLIQIRSDSTGQDTLLVKARLLEAVQTDSLDRLTAVDTVQVWQSDLAAVADSMVYDRFQQPSDTVQTGETSVSERSLIILYREPVLWFKETQLSGDTVRVTMLNDAADSLLVDSRVFVARLDTNLARIQQVQGRRLQGDIEADSLRSLVVSPNAEAIYYMADEDEKSVRGAVRMSSDAIQMEFSKGELKKIKAVKGIQATQYEAEIVPDPFRLSGYRWMPELRPVKAMFLENNGILERLSKRMIPEPDPG